MNLNALAAAIAESLPTGTQVNVYAEPADHAGIGFPHYMLAWVDGDGYPRSVIIPSA